MGACNYSAKYKPLVMAKLLEFGNDQGAFRNWIADTFKDPDWVMSEINNAPQQLSTINVSAHRLMEEKPQDIESIRSQFSNNSTAYTQCINEFARSIVESSIYNADENEWIDAEKLIENGNVTELNKKLFEYKKNLIHRIELWFGVDLNSNIDINDENADEKLTNALYNAIDTVDKAVGNIDVEVFIASVILKNFNRLISEKTPFIQLRKEYEDTKVHGVNMYIYGGPNVKHRVSYTTNEHISAQSQYSDLSKILLNYFPEYDGLRRIPGTSIGVDGFTSVMNKFKTALFYSEQMAHHRTAYIDGNFNIKEALEDYLKIVKDSTKSQLTNRNHITTQINKLQGIIHYIFDSKLDEDVKEMFKGMFEKTVPLSYMTYTWRNGKYGSVNLVDSYINTQMLSLQDTVNGRVAQLRSGTVINGKTELERIKNAWGIQIKDNHITIDPNNAGFTLELFTSQVQKGKYTAFEVKKSVTRGALDDTILANIITDVLGTFLPLDQYSDFSSYVNDKGSLLEDFGDIIAITLLASNPNTSTDVFDSLDAISGTVNFKNRHLFTNFENAARTMSVLYGSETRNVVNDINGNHLPTNGLTSLVFNSPVIAAEMAGWSNEDYDDPFAYNILAPRKDPLSGQYSVPGFYNAIVRQGVKVNGKTKAVSTLNLGELLEIGAIYDYWDNLTDGNNVIYLQNANVADKERHLIIPYILRSISLDDNSYDMASLLKEAAKNGQSEKLVEVWQTLRKKRYDAIANNILKDYNDVFSKDFTTLKQLDDWLISEKMTIDQVREKFRTAINKRNFKDEIHASAKDGIARVNEVLYHFQDSFKDIASAKERLRKSRAFFANDMFKTRLKINRYTNDVVNRKWDEIPSNWKEVRGKIETGNLILFKVFDGKNEIKVTSIDPTVITNPKYRVELNPIFESYLMADLIYSNEYNQLHVGDVFSHPIKNKDFNESDNGWGSSEFYDACEATRLVAQNKRAVIYGASIHSFQHNLANNRGVSDEINVAVMQDIPAFVWNMIGGLKNKSVDDDLDSMDGSGLQSIYEAILEQESLKDAAAGLDEKTILGWNDKFFGRQVLLKWAVYALTNERRRLGRNSEANIETLFERMHSKRFNKTLDMYSLWKKHVDSDIYFKDFDSRKTYKILDVNVATTKDGQNVQVRTAIEVDSYGKQIDGTPIVYLTNRNKIVSEVENASDFTYTTLYDLDQFFGGAYEMSLVDGNLKYTEKGNHIVADIICDEDLKDNFIAYVVNKSAVKVGVENLNDKSAWYNNTPLDTMRMSTKYGGLQMNAEHELEDSEVSEMTQMISALTEKGFSWELVKQIYSDIGDVVLESLKTFKANIKNYGDDPNKLKVMLGKALIEAYARGDRDTLGLAQSFLGKAERMLRENDANFKFPFSGATIHGSFIATVSSLLTKKGIRRKYSGIAAVLTPSYNIIQVYGNGSTLEKHADYLANWKAQPGNERFANVSIDSLINDMFITTDTGIELNPFITFDPNKEFDFEDTIITREYQQDENGNIIYDVFGNPQFKEWGTPIIINSYENYDKYKRFNGEIYVWKSRPRNLKGSNTTYSNIVYDKKAKKYVPGRKYSIYEWTSTRAANYSIKKVWSNQEAAIIYTALRDMLNHYQTDIVFKNKLSSNEEYSIIELAHELQGTELPNRAKIDRMVDVRKSLYNMVQRQLRDLQDKNIVRDVILTKSANEKVTNVNVEAAEIVMGKLFAKQFLLQEGDDVQNILQQGSNFFEKRISARYTPPTDVDSNKYDAVVYTDTNEKILVKIDSNLEYNFDKTSNSNITKVDGKAYLNQKELCDINNKEFYQIQGNNGGFYNVIVLKSTDDFVKLIGSSAISNFSINYDNDPETAIQLTLDTNEDLEIDIDGQVYDVIELLQADHAKLAIVIKDAESKAFKKRIETLSERMFESFKLSLNFIGTRIPAQAMQSFQPMKIVAFTDSETNDVYVNRFNTYIEGSDYDIDKSYILGYEVNEDGLIETGSKLAKWLGIEKALDLTIAKGRHFEEGFNGTIIRYETLLQILEEKNVDQINAILNSENTVLTFEQPILQNTSEKETEKALRAFDRKKARLIKLLNLHESSYQSEAALKNKVVHGIRKVALSPKNQINLHSPISMAQQQDAASRSELGKDELNISIDNPSSKYMMQVQNMTGKQCIGITAVAIKCFFAKSEYYNDLLNQIPVLLSAGQESQILGILNSLVIENPISGEMTLLANVNLFDIFDKVPMDTKLNIQVGQDSILRKFNTSDGKFDLMRCLRELQKHSNRVDAAMELSGLLSASTDNAKELILSKINATSKFIDLYTVAIQCGSTFKEISNIMMSPIFNSISRLADNNIFHTYEGSYKLDRAINFYLNEVLLPGVNERLLSAFISRKLKIDTLKDSKGLYNILDQTDIVESLIGDAYAAAKIANTPIISDDGFELNEDNVRDEYTRKDWLAIANFLEEVVDRNRTKDRLKKQYSNYIQQENNIRLVRDKLIPAADEQNILGRMLGINQGLSTSGYKQYSDIFNIESFVKSRVGEDFDLLTFIQDDIYREDWIKKYESAKSIINVLDVISKVPHFKEMFNILYDNNFILSNLSSRYQLTKDLANKISGEKYPLSEKEFRQVGYYINDLFLVSFLTSINKEIIIPKGVKYYDGTSDNAKSAEKDTPVQLNNLNGLASFKIWVEQYIVPKMKNMQAYISNPFVQSLTFVKTKNNATNQDITYYKLPLNMMTIDHNTADKSKYEVMLNGFKQIVNDTVDGWKVSDLFYVYNAIVNKDGMGQKSMTRIFEDLVDSPSNSELVTKFYDFVSDIDSNPELRQSFIDSALSKYGEDDVKTYIVKHVQGTFIKESNLWTRNSDYTFPMPSLDGTWYANSPKIEKSIESISSYNYGLNNRIILQNLGNELSAKYGAGLVQVHSQEWFNQEFKDNPDLLTHPAFIKNGIIYVNENKADVTDVLHEYTHLILAAIKINEKYNSLYYKLMGEIRNHPNYNRIAEPYKKIGLIGTDLDEEVLVKVLQKFFNNQIAGWSEDNVLNSSQPTILAALNEVLGTNIDQSEDLFSIMNSKPNNIIKKFGSSLFNLTSSLDLTQEALRWRAQTQQLRTILTTGDNPAVTYKCD